MSRHNFMLLFTFQFFSSQEFRVVLLTTARYTKNLQLISVPFFLPLNLCLRFVRLYELLSHVPHGR